MCVQVYSVRNQHARLIRIRFHSRSMNRCAQNHRYFLTVLRGSTERRRFSLVSFVCLYIQKSGMAGIQLVTTGLPSQAHGFTNCVYVSPKDLEALANNAGVEVDKAVKRGLLCAVGEAVFLVQ